MQLLNILKENIIFEKTKYNLKSLIFTPQSDHFTKVLLNYQNEKLNLKKGLIIIIMGIVRIIV